MNMSDDSPAKCGLHLRMHLLLIEDDAEAAKYLAKGLRESGYTVDVAANGRDGLFQATEQQYELIIADRPSGWASRSDECCPHKPPFRMYTFTR